MIIDSVTFARPLEKGASESLYYVKTRTGAYSLKIFSKDFSAKERELFIALQKKQAGLMHVVEFGEKQGKYYLLSEWVEGVSADTLVFTPLLALHILRSLVRSLKLLRGMGFFHGDISLKNVIIQADGNAVLIDPSLNGLGTIFYAAPERFSACEPSEKSDLYALGMLLYRMVGGQLPGNITNTASYEQFSCNIDAFSPLKLLFNSYGSVEICALEPLWKGLLKVNPIDRFEDLEELDENLEIAELAIENSLLKRNNIYAHWVLTLVEPVKNARQNLEQISEIKVYAIKKSKKVPFFLALFIVIFIAFLSLYISKKNTSQDVSASAAQMLLDSRKESPPLIKNHEISKEVLKTLPVP